MLRYLTSPLLQVLGQPPLSQVQQLSRIIWTDDFNIIYITSSGKIEFTRDLVLDPNLFLRDDWVGLASWCDVLILLSRSGELYQATGELIRSDIAHITSLNSDNHLALKLKNGSYQTYTYLDQLLLRDDAPLTECGFPIQQRFMELTSTQCVVKYHRMWARSLELVTERTHTFTTPRSYWNCISDRRETWYFISESGLYELIPHFYLTYSQGWIGAANSYIRSISEPFPLAEFGSDRIQDVQMFCSPRDDRQLSSFAVLCESGKVYTTAGLLPLDRPAVAIRALEDDGFLVLLDDDTIKQYNRNDDGVVICPGPDPREEK
jgi:hypothetical protein